MNELLRLNVSGSLNPTTCDLSSSFVPHGISQNGFFPNKNIPPPPPALFPNHQRTQAGHKACMHKKMVRDNLNLKSL